MVAKWYALTISLKKIDDKLSRTKSVGKMYIIIYNKLYELDERTKKAYYRVVKIIILTPLYYDYDVMYFKCLWCVKHKINYNI